MCIAFAFSVTQRFLSQQPSTDSYLKMEEKKARIPHLRLHNLALSLKSEIVSWLSKRVLNFDSR